MSTISELSLPASGNITVCEQNGQLLTGDCDIFESYHIGEIRTFPKVSISTDSLRRTALVGETAKSAFLEHKESPSQKIISAWHGNGVSGVCAALCSEDMKEEVPPALQTICRYLLIGLRWISGMHFTLFPHLKLSHEDLIAQFSPNKDWNNSIIRYLAWHPKAHKFALALSDDTIKIYYSKNSLIPMLKHKLQKHVTCLEWKPLSASVLAVGTENAILIWNIDPSSYSTRPSAGAVQVLFYSSHTPVTSLAWHPRGNDILVACSALNTAIVAWNSCLVEYQVIQHISTCGGVSRVLWSPDGSKVLAATPTSSFRVFETGMWTNERWSHLSGRVQCACWSPRGTTLLFALAEDPHIYSLKFEMSQTEAVPSTTGSTHGTVVLDLSHTNEEEKERPKSANCIHSMVWDETGERVAVMFHKDDPRHNLVAVFSASEDPVFVISPKGYIQGKESTEPIFIAFKPNYDLGACLTICWSDGTITYVPMYFTASESISGHIKFNQHRNQYTTSLSGTTGLDKSTIWSTTNDSVFTNRTAI